MFATFVNSLRREEGVGINAGFSAVPFENHHKVRQKETLHTYDILMNRCRYKWLAFSRMGKTAVICGALQSNWLPFA